MKIPQLRHGPFYHACPLTRYKKWIEQLVVKSELINLKRTIVFPYNLYSNIHDKNGLGFTLHPFLIYGHCKNQIPNTIKFLKPATTALLPKLHRVTLVHPAKANTGLCENPCAYPSQILCCFPASWAIFTQNKQQFDEQLKTLDSPLCRIVSTPCPFCPTISSLWLREVTVPEVSHLMNVHFSFQSAVGWF